MPYISFILILLSVFGVVLVVGLKIFEIKTGRSGVLAKASDAADPLIRNGVDAVKRIFQYASAANARKFFGASAGELFHYSGIAGLFVSKHYAGFLRWIKGRKYIKGGGVVSFFLKNVAESKGEKKDSN